MEPIDVKLKTGQVGMFGYGSLLWRESMELTLGRRYLGPSVTCSLHGWRRSWDIVMPNTSFYELTPSGEFVPESIIYLNVRHDRDERVNGLLYVIEDEDLLAFDRREWIYTRMNVTSDIRDVIISGGDVYTYVGKQEYCIPPHATRPQAAVRSYYLEIISKGLMELRESFAEKYYASTDPVPTQLILVDQKRAGTHPHLAEQSNSSPSSSH